MESWKGENIWTRNWLNWTHLLNQTTAEWGVGPFPSNLVAIPTSLDDANYGLDPGALVIENASIAEAGSRDVEKIIFGVTAGAVILFAIIWLIINRDDIKTLCRDVWSSMTGGPPPEIRHDPRTANGRPGSMRSRATSDTLQMSTLGNLEDGTRQLVKASTFREHMARYYYPTIVSELELYEKDIQAEGISGEDIEKVSDLMRQKFRLDTEVWSHRHTVGRSQARANVPRAKSAAVMADVQGITGTWFRHMSSLALGAKAAEHLDDIRESLSQGQSGPEPRSQQPRR